MKKPWWETGIPHPKVGKPDVYVYKCMKNGKERRVDFPDTVIWYPRFYHKMQLQQMGYTDIKLIARIFYKGKKDE